MRKHGEGWLATGEEVLVVQTLRERRRARRSPDLAQGREMQQVRRRQRLHQLSGVLQQQQSVHAKMNNRKIIAEKKIFLSLIYF